MNNDAAAIAALFTRDAVFVTPEGPITSRQAIQKYYTDLYQRRHPKNCISKVDGNAVHLIGTAGNELWATGEWGETGQGKNGIHQSVAPESAATPSPTASPSTQ